MRIIEFIVALLAIILLCRGAMLLLAPKKLRKFILDHLRKPKDLHYHTAWTLILAAIVLVIILIGRMDIMHMVVLLSAGMLFMTGWALFEAKKETLLLWRAYAKKSDSWYRIMGVVNISCAFALVIYLLLKASL